MIPTFALLALAVVALWCQPRADAAAPTRSMWLWLWAASLVAAGCTGIVTLPALGWIAAWVALAYALARPPAGRAARAALVAAVIGLASGLMAHVLPGFHNPRVLDAVRFTPDALPFRLHLNYDKTLVGLFLLGWCHHRIASAGEWRLMARRAAAPASGVIALLLVVSLIAGYVRFDPKLPAAGLLWLVVNLLSTCVAEEAFFRGFVQHGLQRRWAGRTGGAAAAIAVAALLFGLAHAAGGPTYVVLATLAGLGYGWAYQRTGCIEASILTHAALNAVHFFGFTYPALERAAG